MADNSVSAIFDQPTCDGAILRSGERKQLITPVHEHDDIVCTLTQARNLQCRSFITWPQIGAGTRSVWQVRMRFGSHPVEHTYPALLGFPNPWLSSKDRGVSSP
jgi:hypothetical protein